MTIHNVLLGQFDALVRSYKVMVANLKRQAEQQVIQGLSHFLLQRFTQIFSDQVLFMNNTTKYVGR